MYHILLVEDEETLRLTLADDLRDAGFLVSETADVCEAMALWNSEPFDILITDLKLPGEHSGLTLLEWVKKQSPTVVAVMITAFGTVQNAVQAMKMGADDYLTKPFTTEELLMILERATRLRQLESENRELRQRLGEQFQFTRIIGDSPAMRQIKETLKIVAPTDETVLLEGETGTGKELIAQAIHENSPRAKGPFMAVSCASLPEGLLESELFGHEKGAFTGAYQRKIGRFEVASGGTVLLDEIDDIPLALQVKLLRLLQEREFQRVGSTQTMTADVRVVAATKKDLSELVEQEKFRSDLYYRLNVIPIYIPPLRHRREDILPLFRHFVAKAMGDAFQLEFQPMAWKCLFNYDWPGNVRQLENLVKRLLIFGQGQAVSLELLPPEITQMKPEKMPFTDWQELDYKQILSDCERRLLETAMSRAKGNKSYAAELLGLRPSTFRDRLAKFGIA